MPEEKIGVGLLAGLVFGFFLLFGLVLLFDGCCRSCPKPEIPVVVIPPACELPSGPTSLPTVKRIDDGCPESLVCFDIENAARLAARDGKMKQWIREAKARCSNPLDAGADR